MWAATAVVALLLVPPGAASPVPAGPRPAPLAAVSSPAPTTGNATDLRHWVVLNGTSGPVPPAGGAMAYDPSLGGIVLFGGLSDSYAYLNGTWLFRDDGWTEICNGRIVNQSCPTSPPARTQDVMAFDAADNELLMFGGYGVENGGYTEFGDTWALRNSTWVLLSSDLAPNLVVTSLDASMAYDPTGGFTYLELPYQPSAKGTGAAYEYENGSWVHAPPVPSPLDPVFFDATSGVLTAASPVDSGSVFTLGVAGWKAAGWADSPVGADYPQLLGATFDPVAGQEVTLVQTYDYSTSPVTSEVVDLALDGGNWSDIDPGVAGAPTFASDWPLQTSLDGFAFDPEIGASIAPTVNWSYANGTPKVAGAATWGLTDPLSATLHVSVPATDVGVGVQWEIASSGGFGGTSVGFQSAELSECSSTLGSSSMSCSYAAAGTFGVTGVIGDGLGDSTTASGQVVIHPDPDAVGTTTEAATTVGAPVGFVGVAAGGTPPVVGTWAFGDGAVVTTANATHAYTAAGNFTATWSVIDGVGLTSVRHVTVVVNPTLAVNAHVSRVVVDAGVADQFGSDLSGGTYPTRIAWTFGDGSTGSGTNATHAYSEPGEYLAAATATDYVGTTAQSRLYVQVEPTLVTAAGANESTVTAGSPVLIAAGALGGAAPYSYWWVLGDGQWDTAPRFVHVFPVPGVYGISVVVNDSAGGSQEDQFVVDVAPVPVPAPPAGGPPPAAPGGVSGGGPPSSEPPRLTQHAGASGPLPLGDAILIAGIAAVLVIALGSALDRRRGGARRRRRS